MNEDELRIRKEPWTTNFTPPTADLGSQSMTVQEITYAICPDCGKRGYSEDVAGGHCWECSDAENERLRAALMTIKCHLYAVGPTAPWIADCRQIADAALAHQGGHDD